MKKKIITLVASLLILVNLTPVLAAASKNNNLKDLTIENHNIYFNKERTKYSIVVDKDENSLNINIVKDDVKQKVEVVGDKDLKANDYKVTIKVTAENGLSKTYIIEAEVKKDIEEKKEKSFFDGIKDWFDKLNLKTEIILIIVGALLFIILLIFILRKVRDRKIEKTMDKF